MAESSWPNAAHNSRAVTDSEYEAMAARFSDNGVNGTPSGDAVVSAGAGLNVAIRPGVYANVRGHAWYSGTSTITLAITANSSGSTRIDRVVLRLDRSDWTVKAVVKTGTPGAGPPTLTQDIGDTGVYEILLANVTLLSGASSVTVTRNELYIGSRIRPCTSTTRSPTPTVGEMCFETDTSRTMQWTGSGWRSVSNASDVIVINSPTSAWTNEVDSVLEMKNGIVCLRLGAIQRAGGTLAADIESRLPVLVPTNYLHATRDQYVLAYVTGVEIARIIIYSKASDKAGQVWLTNKPVISHGDNLLPASGVSWVVN